MIRHQRSSDLVIANDAATLLYVSNAVLVPDGLQTLPARRQIV